MTQSNKNIAGELLGLEPADASPARAQYERRIADLFERKPAGADWLRLGLMLVGGLAGATLCGTLALTEPAELPTRTRVALSALAVIGLSWVGLAGVILRRGAINSRIHGTVAATIGFAFSLLATAAIGILAMTGHAAGGTGLVLLPLVPLVLASVVLVVHHINQAELRLRRDLMEIGYQLSRRSSPGA